MMRQTRGLVFGLLVLSILFVSLVTSADGVVLPDRPERGWLSGGSRSPTANSCRRTTGSIDTAIRLTPSACRRGRSNG